VAKLPNYGQIAKLNVRQSVSAVKSPNLMSTEYTTSIVHVYLVYCMLGIFEVAKLTFAVFTNFLVANLEILAVCV